MASHSSCSKARTSLVVRLDGEIIIELVSGPRHCWSFRPHYHLGDEVVRITEGRTRFHSRAGFQDLEAGETTVVPAGVVHRFQPLDREGWSFQSQYISGPGVARNEPQNPLCLRAIGELSGRSSLQTDVIGVASACAISAGHLSRLFRHEVGTSLHNFHVLLALHKAMQLLRLQQSVVSVALDTGFFDQAHFTREFVRLTGMTPGIFRSAWAPSRLTGSL